jgi:hypothetical protein
MEAYTINLAVALLVRRDSRGVSAKKYGITGLQQVKNGF